MKSKQLNNFKKCETPLKLYLEARKRQNTDQFTPGYVAHEFRCTDALRKGVV